MNMETIYYVVLCWRKLWQHSNKYVWLCPECQQVTLKETLRVVLNLLIPKFSMSFISMDLLGSYCKIENGNQYALTVICMMTNYVFMISFKSKTTEEGIKACSKNMYLTFMGSKYILECQWRRIQ